MVLLRIINHYMLSITIAAVLDILISLSSCQNRSFSYNVTLSTREKPLIASLSTPKTAEIGFSSTASPVSVTESPKISSLVELPFDSSVYPAFSKPIFRPVFTSINHGERHVYTYTFNNSTLLKYPALQVQLYAEAEGESSEDETFVNYPLHVTVHWHGAVRSWDVEIDYLDRNSSMSKMDRFANHTVGKTLWLFPSRVSPKSLHMMIEVSSVADLPVFYKIRIVPLKNFFVKPDIPVMGIASPTTPAFFRFDDPLEYWEYAFIHVISATNTCTAMTIEQPRGPFLEPQASSIGKKHFMETFTRKTGLTIKMDDFPQGFLIIFTPFLNDQKCQKIWNNNTANDPFRIKEITFQVREVVSVLRYPYYYPLAIPLGVFSFIAFLVLWAHRFFHMYRITRIKERKQAVEQYELALALTLQFQSRIAINDLIITEPGRVVGQTNRYCSASFVTSAFYTVPVFQLIFTFSRRLIESGNFDICYFNHFCSHNLGHFHDFNHMYSNIWYILFGILYMSLVRIRQVSYVANYVEETDEERKNASYFRRIFPKTDGNMDIGVMKHYGLLYCMGYALIMTGVMSAAYHVCPNQSNFQFDTVFMYTIGAITVVTIYQARHPTYLSANFTFTALALVTCTTVLGLLWEEFFIRVTFSAAHMLFLVLCLPKVCYNGYVRKDGELVVHWLDMMQILSVKVKDDWKHKRICQVQEKTWHSPELSAEIIAGAGRLVLPGFLLLINCIAIAATWTVMSDENFATQVLFICVMNGGIYTIFYSVLKLFHRECQDFMWIQPGFYLTMSFFLWAYSMYYFYDEVSTWESSPAESRLKNTDCIFLQFYDSHDMWHFISAAALFSSAMVLLTVDDDLLDRHKATIPVF